jgi:hypothetical protein
MRVKSDEKLYTHSLFFHPITTVDIVSAVEFNETGEYIATGDRGGRVVIFERCQVKLIFLMIS